MESAWRWFCHNNQLIALWIWPQWFFFFIMNPICPIWIYQTSMRWSWCHSLSDCLCLSCTEWDLLQCQYLALPVHVQYVWTIFRISYCLQYTAWYRHSIRINSTSFHLYWLTEFPLVSPVFTKMGRQSTPKFRQSSLHLYRGVRPPPNPYPPQQQRVFWIWHLTIWGWGSSLAALRNVEYPFIAITSKSTLYLLGSHLWIK